MQGMARLLVLVFASCLHLEEGRAEAWRPMPDAAYGVFLDTGSLQDFMTRLPVPARKALRGQAGPVPHGEGIVVAFLGTSAEPARLRIDRIEIETRRVSVHLALRRVEAAGDSVQPPYYPLVSGRLHHLPQPPFDVRFLGERGELLALIQGVRPLIVPGNTPRTAGDPWGVVREIERRVELRCDRDCPSPPGPGAVVGRGTNLVRVHHTTIPLFHSTSKDTLWLGGKLPDWLRLARSRCRLTDRSPEAIASARENDAMLRPEDVLTINGSDRLRLGVNAPPRTSPAARPTRPVWLACDWSLPPQGNPDEPVRDLGTWVIDLYPAELHYREAGTIEITSAVESWHDLTLRFRLFPPYSNPRDRSVPIRLLIHDPTPVPGTDPPRRLGAFLYYGFDRDPNRGVYVVHLGKDERGDWYTWLALQDPEKAFEYELQARLALCRSPGTDVVLGDDACDTAPAVQAFYTHARYLEAHRLRAPVRLRLSLRSPRGYRSRPFEVVLGDERTVPWIHDEYR